MSIRKHLDHLIGLHIVFFLFTFVPATPITDMIATGGNITGGDTLVSAGGSFTLGFFSPPGEPTKLYLGIWFSFSREAICWVANRDNPLNDTSGGVLMLTKLGTLLLLDGSNNSSVWSSGSMSSSSSPPATGARLLDSGNFVVVQGQDNSTFQWQSFDHPCNVLLPGMKIGKNLWNGGGWYLSSWRSAADPGVGSYRYVTELGGGTPENVLWDSNDGTKKYRTGPWNGGRFDGVPAMASYASDFVYHLTISASEVTYSYTVKAGAPAAYSQLKLGEGGLIQRLTWDESNRQWHPFLKQPRDVDCDNYAFCGPFGLCDRNAVSTSLCSCFDGFVQAFPKEWSLRNYSGGCRRNVSLDCSNRSRSSTDGFLVVPLVKLPDTQNASVVMDISLEECKLRCVANCSCVAYAAAEVTTGGGSGCIIWTDSFIDLRFIEEGQDFYLRQPKSLLPVTGGKNNRKVVRKIVASSIGSFVGALALAAIIFGIVRRLRSSRPVQDPSAPPPTLPRPAPAGNWIDYQILKDAISKEKEIGKGSFGTVYQCELPPQESTRIGLPVGVNMVAVKVLNQSVLNNLERELQVLFVLSHVNLVRLLAYSSHNTDAAGGVLIYEYMKNGSLHPYVFGEDGKRTQLSWTQRLQIITSIADGVWYLHWGCGRHVLHRDLKPANILLADDFTPKIADFGLAKQAPDPTAFHTPVGAYGYSAPECREGQTTKKSDVYSFGVVMLETISGIPNCVTLMQRLLLPQAWNSWNTDNDEARSTLEKLRDPKVPLSQEEKADPKFLSRLWRCIQIGLLCVQFSPDNRPDITAVVNMLKTEGELPKPEEPTL